MSRIAAVLRSWAVDVTPLRVNRQFRLLFTGRLVSLIGLSMLTVVFSVHAYDLTGSSLHVALINTALGLSTLAGALVGGVLADRTDRRRVILISRGLALAGFVALAVNAMLPSPMLWVLYAFALWDGITGSIGATAFGAAVPSVVPRSMLPATGALMAISIDLGAAIAPVAGGLIAAGGGYELVYGLVAAISAASWLVLFRLRPMLPGAGEDDGPDDPDDPDGEQYGEDDDVPETVRGAVGSWYRDLTQGVRFVRRERVVGAVLMIGVIQILFASPHVLIPQFVTENLGGGAAEAGLMYSAASVGALLATLASGGLARVRRIGLLVIGVNVFAALTVVGFGLAQAVWMAAAAMLLVGAGDVVAEILRFTVISESTPDRLRGRVQGLWSAQTTAGDSLGGPALSIVARFIGAGGAIVTGGLIAAAAVAAMLLTNPELRRLQRDPDQPAGDGMAHEGDETAHEPAGAAAEDVVAEAVSAGTGATENENEYRSTLGGKP